MNSEAQEFLYKLLKTPSPTGFEQQIQRVVRKRMEKYADSIETDLHGNVIIGINTKAQRKIMLAGHCDQIGFSVKHISEQGFLYVSALGGIDVGVTYGASVVVQGKDGPLPGVIGRKPIHLQKSEERSSMKTDIDKIWIDIGAENKKAAEKLVAIGDPVVYRPEVTELCGDLVTGPGLDNRVGLFVALEALRLSARAKLSVGLYAVSTVQEEVGLRGAKTAAFSIDPEVGIGIDVTHATDNPGHDDTKAVPVKIGAGPTIVRGPNINPVVSKMLFAAAKKGKIPHQPAPTSSLLGNDTNVIQVSRGGVATGCLGIPNRYMHTQAEICALSDLENAAKLLARFVAGVTPRTDFRPL